MDKIAQIEKKIMAYIQKTAKELNIDIRNIGLQLFELETKLKIEVKENAIIKKDNIKVEDVIKFNAIEEFALSAVSGKNSKEIIAEAEKKIVNTIIREKKENDNADISVLILYKGHELRYYFMDKNKGYKKIEINTIIDENSKSESSR